MTIIENREHYLDELINNAIMEDIGDGDHTSLACIPENKTGTAEMIAKQDGIFAGAEITKIILGKIDKSLVLNLFTKDGTEIKTGNTILEISGKVLSILKIERILLNTLQRMCGIATQTHEYVKKLEGLKTKILDTRKTTPGMRILEKDAVRIGGGMNHRMGLFDMVLIKDNHVDFAGGIENAITASQNYLKAHNKNLKIEIEAQSLADVGKILEHGGADIVLLDNFSVEDTRKAVKLINGRMLVESSGMINLGNIREYAECGVDYISVGALTHQIKSLDLSLKAKA